MSLSRFTESWRRARSRRARHLEQQREAIERAREARLRGIETNHVTATEARIAFDRAASLAGVAPQGTTPHRRGWRTQGPTHIGGTTGTGYPVARDRTDDAFAAFTASTREFFVDDTCDALAMLEPARAVRVRQGALSSSYVMWRPMDHVVLGSPGEAPSSLNQPDGPAEEVCDD